MEAVLGIKAISVEQRNSKQQPAIRFKIPRCEHCVIFSAKFPRGIASRGPVCLHGSARNGPRLSCRRHRGVFGTSCLGGLQFVSPKPYFLFEFNQFQARKNKRQAGHWIVRCDMAGAIIPDGADRRLAFFTDATIGPRLRGFSFYTMTCFLAIPLFVAMLLVHPFVLVFDKHRRKAHHLINKVWASFTVLPFFKVDIEGLENLPPPNVPAVYVSNHQSYLDIYTLLLLGRSFKFISKTSIFLIPIIGWSMFLTGHIPLRRMDKKSQMECLKQCLDVLNKGASVLFFPEGTRSKDGKMASFKKGAFSVAAKARAPIVPITLIGTGKLMPNGMEGTLRSGSIKLIIHQPIEGRDADELCERARDMIAQKLIMHGHGVH